MTLDYKCVYIKIWIFPSVDCNHHLKLFCFYICHVHCILFCNCMTLGSSAELFLSV